MSADTQENTTTSIDVEPCRLLDPPPELRNRIYRYFFTAHTPIKEVHLDRAPDILQKANYLVNVNSKPMSAILRAVIHVKIFMPAQIPITISVLALRPSLRDLSPCKHYREYTSPEVSACLPYLHFLTQKAAIICNVTHIVEESTSPGDHRSSRQSTTQTKSLSTQHRHHFAAKRPSS